MTFIGSKNFFFEVAKGNISGHTAVIYSAHNPDIDTASGFEDIWEAGGSLSYLSAAETMLIASTSTDDDGSPGGVGARTLLITGLGDSTPYEEVSETITLDGTTNVTTVNSYLRVRRMVVLTAGSSGGNVGNITATASIAGTVQCEMDSGGSGDGESVSQDIHYTTPAGKTSYILQGVFSAIKTSGSDPIVEFRAMVRTSATDAPWVQVFDFAIDTSIEDIFVVEQPIMPALAAGTDIRVEAKTDTNNTEVRARIFLIEVDD